MMGIEIIIIEKAMKIENIAKFDRFEEKQDLKDQSRFAWMKNDPGSTRTHDLQYNRL